MFVIDDSQELNPCPNCGGEPIQMVAFDNTGGTPAYYVKCRACGTRSGQCSGPVARVRSVKAWNSCAGMVYTTIGGLNFGA